MSTYVESLNDETVSSGMVVLKPVKPELEESFEEQEYNETSLRKTAFQSKSINPDSNLYERIRVDQEFDGVVVSTDPEKREFTATISDLTHPDNPAEIIEVPFSNILEGDIPLVNRGARFRWIFGRRLTSKGIKTNQGFDQFIFRRVPNWSDYKIREAKKLADELLAGIHQSQ